MTHNQRQKYMGTLYRLATNESADLDFRYGIARDMQRQRSGKSPDVPRETLFRAKEMVRRMAK
jgi:hypothetical protein